MPWLSWHRSSQVPAPLVKSHIDSAFTLPLLINARVTSCTCHCRSRDSGNTVLYCIAPVSLCDAISGVMLGPDGQGCCPCPSDITPARDGPAHAYPDDAVDGAARANRTICSQYNAPTCTVAA